jgi:hypothetical protein
VAARVRVHGSDGRLAHTVETFGTTEAADLLTVRDWVEAHGVTHVAIESTGVSYLRSAPALVVPPATLVRRDTALPARRRVLQSFTRLSAMPASCLRPGT